ncbi:uncharacterized protein LOC134837348 [Culicoides brevitarsis]|uniref:uncharacterized protein LOC134837348 n=1 Tax=Culicoides brevitarsis TaxID=469753 RepID=UPI00307B14BF
MEKSIFLLVVAYFALVACNKSANEQCLNRIFPGKKLEDVKWGKLMVEAFVKDNRDYQCFILCGLSNLNILTKKGIVETKNNPLASELGDEIAACSALVEHSADNCVNAKKFAQCLFNDKGPITDKSGAGKIIMEENQKFKEAGKTIEY